MEHTNFLPPDLKLQTPPDQKKPKFKVFNSWEQWALLGVFVLAVTFVVFAYPAADAAYRATKIYPLVKEIKQSAQNGDFTNLYEASEEASAQFTKVNADLRSLLKLKFIPGLGRKIESAFYLSEGGEKAIRVFLPILKTLTSTDGSLHDIQGEQRKFIITQLAAHSDELRAASADFQKADTSLFPDDAAKLIAAFDVLSDVGPDLPKVLGVDRPARYLVIFANNLEIRPAGGFIGTYALLTLENGEIKDLSVRDSYQLPGARNFSIGPLSPPVVQQYLGIRGFPFRDINWWPDYPTSAKALKEQYTKEGGEYGTEIAGVMTFTTEILKKVVEITGPVYIDDVIFNKDNAVYELQKQVEVTFWDKGIPVTERKDIVGDLAAEVYKRIQGFSFQQNLKLLDTFAELGRTRHMALYFENPELQKFVASKEYDAVLKPAGSDSLMIVDANLAGFKTEPFITKNISYSVDSDNGKLVSTLTLNYRHRGTYASPLVNNYRTYTRIYVPKGAKLISGPVEVGEELGRTVFSALQLVPISEERTLTIKYELPPHITQPAYSLLVQKQLGTLPAGLQVNFNFGNLKKQFNETFDSDKVYKY